MRPLGSSRTCTGAGSPMTWTRCSPCRESVPTRHERCWRSRSRPRSPCSTPTSGASSPAATAPRCRSARHNSERMRGYRQGRGGPGTRPCWTWVPCTADLGHPSARGCPVAPGCSWHRAGHPDPDPASGSAAVSRPQARFEGSARQARGRVMAALAAGPVELVVARSAIGWHDRDDAVAAGDAVIESLLADGLAVLDEHGRLALPG